MKKLLNIILNDGPLESDYPELKKVIEGTIDFTTEEEAYLQKFLSPILTLDTIQGHAYLKPYGYSGDFEIIDKIYTSWESSNPKLKRWDKFFHSLEAPKAVRNRKEYFIKLIQSLTNKEANVLNIGSGPGRDIKEYFDTSKSSLVKFDCIDFDEKAIDYATDVCKDYLENINFININIFRFKAEKKYDLIWSAGLFDYFTDKQFVRLLKQLKEYVAKDGMLVIGNFSKNNPSQPYIEKYASWNLNHRSKEELIDLALSTGCTSDSIEIHSEEEGINLFMHIKNI